MSLPSEVGALLTWLLQAEVAGSARSSRGLKRIQKGQLPDEWQSSSKFWASFHGGASGDLANDGPSEKNPRMALVPNFAPLPIDMDYVISFKDMGVYM